MHSCFPKAAPCFETPERKFPLCCIRLRSSSWPAGQPIERMYHDTSLALSTAALHNGRPDGRGLPKVRSRSRSTKVTGTPSASVATTTLQPISLQPQIEGFRGHPGHARTICLTSERRRPTFRGIVEMKDERIRLTAPARAKAVHSVTRSAVFSLFPTPHALPL